MCGCIYAVSYGQLNVLSVLVGWLGFNGTFNLFCVKSAVKPQPTNQPRV